MNKDARDEGFLGRWSRLKNEARDAPPQPPVEAAPAASADEAPPELPPVDTLTFDSDFRGFLHPKVDENVRRSALRKLFSDPQFNVMDGLDVYIDDYSVSEPIPAEMLAGMKQAQRILRWAEGQDDEELDGKRDEKGEGRVETRDEDRLEARDEDAVQADAAAAPAIAVDDPPPDASPAADPLPQAVAKPD
jgi:hypothetical protein